MMTKEDYMRLPKERLAELLVERDKSVQPVPCTYKANALSEVLGYLEGIEVQLKAEIEAIKKELEERK